MSTNALNKDLELSPPVRSRFDEVGRIGGLTAVRLVRQCWNGLSAYRRQGLPTTSVQMESFFKEINVRVKGTEKFWNDRISGEAILQIRAAALCEDDRLSNFLGSRPGHPFHPNAPRRDPLTTAS